MFWEVVVSWGQDAAHSTVDGIFVARVAIFLPSLRAPAPRYKVDRRTQDTEELETTVSVDNASVQHCKGGQGWTRQGYHAG